MLNRNLFIIITIILLPISVISAPFETKHLSSDQELLTLLLSTTFVPEGRIGNNGLSGDYELDIHTVDPFTVHDSKQFVWQNNVSEPFIITYVHAARRVTYVVGNQTLSYTVPDPVLFNNLFIRTRAVNANTSIRVDQLQLNGIPVDDVSHAVADGLDILWVSGMTPNSDFVLTGQSTMSWTGSTPTASRLAYQVKVGYSDQEIPVELTAFSANVEDGDVIVRWKTATETENLGFHIHRCEEESGCFTRINPSLIPGAGSSAEEHHYMYRDEVVTEGKTYFYKLAEVDFNGKTSYHGPITVTVEAIPQDYALHQNYPNPFNSETTLRFSLKSGGDVSLRIYNAKGEFIRILLNEARPAGIHLVRWDGKDENHRPLSSGLYYCIMKVNSAQRTGKLIFMK